MFKICFANVLEFRSSGVQEFRCSVVTSEPSEQQLSAASEPSEPSEPAAPLP
jgi:hypothetical protein